MRTYDRRGVLAAGAAIAAACAGARLEQAVAAVTPTPSGTLHYYNWIAYVSPETYAAFTKATGITVKKSYFASNEALMARLRNGARGYDLAAPSGYAVAELAADGLLEKLDWKRLPTVRRNIDGKFTELPHDPDGTWSVPKDWGTTGFVYRTDRIKERPASWAQFFALFEKYPRRLTLLDSAAEVVGSVAVMLGYSYNTDSPKELARVERFLLDLRPFVHSFDSSGYVAKIVRGAAFGGMAWNGDGAFVVARTPKNAAQYVVAAEGGEFWVDAHVIPKGAPNPGAAHRWIDFVYTPRINAIETLYTYFGSPLRRSLFDGVLAATVLKNRNLFPRRQTLARLEASNLSPQGVTARQRIWKLVKGS